MYWSSDVCSSDRPRAAARIHPGLAVAGRTPVAVMPAIGDPFADIAGKVVKAVCIGGEAGDGRRPPEAVGVTGERVVPVPAAGRLVAAAGEVAGIRGRCPVAPREARDRKSTRLNSSH